MYAQLEKLMQERGTNMSRVSRDTGIAKTTLSSWKSGRTKSLSAANLSILAAYFDVPVEYFVTGDAEEKYYEDPVTAELAQRMKDDHDLRLLFSAARDARPETLQAVYDVLVALKKRERGED